MRLLFVLFCFTIIGCSYNFQDDNFIDLKSPNPDDVSISINSFTEGDTINEDKLLFYNIEQGENQFGISTEILIDNNRIASSLRTTSGEFTVRASRYDDGEHTIRIVHELTSGSGSISEQMQQETITVVKDFKININRKPTDPPRITDARIENGSITLEWQNENENELEFVNAYLSIQFPDYENRIPLTAEILEQEFYIDTYTVLFPLNPNHSEDDDRSRANFSILLESEYEEVYGLSKSLEHDPAWIDVSMSFIDFENFSISWPQHPLYANFDSYRISLLTDYNNDGYAFSASTQGGTELINEPYSFGAEYFGSLFPETEYDPYISSYRYNPRLDETSFKTIQIDQYYGKDFIFNPSTQRYYLLALESNATAGNRGVSIFEYTSDLQFIKRTLFLELDPFWNSLKFSMVMDPDTNNFYLDLGYRTRDLQLINLTMELDKNNLTKLQEFSSQGLSGSEVFQLRGNVLKTWNYQTKILSLTNTDTSEIFYSLNTGGSNVTNVGYFSDDGKYMHLNLENEDAIYKIENNSLEKRIDFEELPRYSFSEQEYAIDIYDDKVYYASYDNNVKVIDLITNQTLSTINYQAGNNNSSASYDPISNKLLVTQGERCFMTDLNTGAFSRFNYESDKGYSQLGGDYFLWLTNGKLIHSKGIYVDIE